jgi:tRNA-specific 2-thiouridylase
MITQQPTPMTIIPIPSYIMVGMSGGVDSSIAAYMLQQAGHRVEGIFMNNWESDDNHTDDCPAATDIADAQAVCDRLGIELHVVNFTTEYWQTVFTHFLQEYRVGRTPNPDILCNKEIKFKAFLHYARHRGAHYIATGHYARLSHSAQSMHLHKGIDPQKDQSYFLHALDKEQLAHSIFPIGHLLKSDVRAMAKKLGLKNHAKKDSTGICFIGERKFKTFLSHYLPAQPGMIETLTGEIIGQHDGLMFYTLGQRQGLHIGGRRGKIEQPWYVAKKDIPNNKLIVVQGNQHPALFTTSLTMHTIHWINDPPSLPLATHAKTRYRQSDQSCTIDPLASHRYLVTFTHPQRAVTPGQSIVFYQGDICLGGGIIEHP